MPKATFAAGCFWGIELKFSQLPGVTSTIVGYTGGSKINPTYEEVCSGETNHAEAVQIEYNEDKISYNKLLELFFQIHNPTSLNRQGFDVGSQYRSVIFYHSDEQKSGALRFVKALQSSNQYPSPIVTEIIPAKTFYKAEEYHQKYLQKKGQSHC